eukprot:CAMPEP_0172171550 /NCGR_PEP_ID=MMETSP1050-20130122/11955_1 /TAXON_ID=233186 /ORGANISM="Cryptomonas curvata, Strain CCAP979/52" /LENGTH=175 /DNA_ID=CAMNT_0012842995 /DNA_START=79 /DNA_END=606 /DNA_ORIENTATION=-
MNTPWGFQNHLNNLATLPMMRVPAFNAASCFCPSMNTPQLPSRSPANVYKSNLKVQAQIQTQQIDSAIQLLKMQYDAIMASVQTSHQPLEQPSSATSASATSSPVVDQKSFSAQFELPGPESDEQPAEAREMDSATTSKRRTAGISITSLVDSESCPSIKTSECNLQSKKRLRRQ